MIRLVLLVLLLLPLGASAGNQTYCVGGSACNSAAVRAQHRVWHFHTYLTDGTTCYSCYDEQDDSCETDFLAKNKWKGWRLADAYQCQRLKPAPAPVYEAMNRGVPVVDAAAEALKKQQELERLAEQARKEAEKAKAEQARKAEEERLRREAEARRLAEEQARIKAEKDAARRQELERQAELERKRQQAELERMQREAANAAEAARLAEEARKKREEAERQAREAAAREAARQAEENKPIPVTLKHEIVRSSPGPHAAGDSVTVVARFLTSTGAARGAGGGTLTLTKADGSTEQVKGRPQADGTVVFEFSLPPGGDSSYSLTLSQPKLEHRETASGTIAPVGQKLSVSPCRLRARITSPQSQQPATPGTMSLRAEILDAQGKPSSALGGASLVFTAAMSSGSSLRSSASLVSTGVAEGSITLPKPSGAGDSVTFSLLVEGGAGDVCPGGEITLPLNELGVAADISRLPSKCYVGKPCDIDVTLRLPDDPGSRTAANAFVSAPDLEASVNLGGTTTRLSPGAAGSFKASPTPTLPGDLEVIVQFSQGGRTVQSTGIVPVRWPLTLVGPPELDLGTRQAGEPWQDTCVMLDLSGSTGVEEQDLEVFAEIPAGCEGELVGNFGGLRGKYSDRVTLEMDASRLIPVCLQTSACAKSESPQGLKLIVRATSPEFQDQKIEVPVKYRLEGGSWLSCNLWWMASLVGLFFFGLVVRGFLVPLDFSEDDVLRVASKEAALARAAARRMREMPGGKRGWYRSAKFGLRSDGSATSDVKTALVVFEAGRSEVIVSARGTLQKMNPRTHKLEPVSDAQNHSLSRNAVYEIGGLFFKVS